MGLIRFVFFLLIAGTVWFMVKNYLRKTSLREQQLRGRRKAGNSEQLAGGRIVRCTVCDVHLPEQDALRAGDTWFCSQAHKQAWLASSQDKN
jgi:hypothetical protein